MRLLQQQQQPSRVLRKLTRATLTTTSRRQSGVVAKSSSSSSSDSRGSFKKVEKEVGVVIEEESSPFGQPMVISPVVVAAAAAVAARKKTAATAAASSSVFVSQHVLSLSQMERLANAVNMSISAVLRTRNTMYSLVCRDAERCGTYTDDEVRDALCCDPDDVATLERLLRALHARAARDGERLPDGVFLLLGFLVFFALFKLEQTGVNVDVVDAFHSLDPAERALVSRSLFVSLFFRYGTCGAVPLLNKFTATA